MAYLWWRILCRNYRCSDHTFINRRVFRGILRGLFVLQNYPWVSYFRKKENGWLLWLSTGLVFEHELVVNLFIKCLRNEIGRRINRQKWRERTNRERKKENIKRKERERIKKKKNIRGTPSNKIYGSHTPTSRDQHHCIICRIFVTFTNRHTRSLTINTIET